MGNNKFNLTLYLVTDRLGMDEVTFLKKIEEAIKGGVTLIQLREKNLTTKEYIELACKVKKITDRYGIPLIIDDRVDVCLAVKASGVHLGNDDMDIKTAREILGDGYIIGATAKTPEKAAECEEKGADYLGCGAVYPTTTKVITHLTSVSVIKEITQRTGIPAVAIGGLNSSNLSVLKGSGVKGISVVSAIMKSEDPNKESQNLLTLTKEILEI